MSFTIGKDCQIHPTAVINVWDGYLGDRSIVNEGAIIEGAHVEIGKEAWIHRRAWIGGGSAFDTQSKLIAGDFLHMGVDSHINIAREVHIGHECGLGFATRILTHGSYESELDGFPVSFGNVYIGDRVWLPNAWVNPGVMIGNNVVVAAMSLVNRDLPDGCLAGGIPAKVLKEHEYPKTLTLDEKQEILMNILAQTRKWTNTADYPPRTTVDPTSITIVDRDTLTFFVTDLRVIKGSVTSFTEALKNQLRRHGIRFRYTAVNGEYKAW